MAATLHTPSRIYLLRHAEAAWAQPGERDFDRALSEKGYGDAEILADRAADKGYHPDIILSSTAKRCRQTADAVHRAMGLSLELRYIDELYNAAPNVYLELLDTQEANAVMLVGHNPTIEQTLEALIGHEQLLRALPGGFPAGGLAVLDFDAAAAAWKLREFLSG
jgi:phosphohistidine phosphatase